MQRSDPPHSSPRPFTRNGHSKICRLQLMKWSRKIFRLAVSVRGARARSQPRCTSYTTSACCGQPCMQRIQKRSATRDDSSERLQTQTTQPPPSATAQLNRRTPPFLARRDVTFKIWFVPPSRRHGQQSGGQQLISGKGAPIQIKIRRVTSSAKRREAHSMNGAVCVCV
jgi:hypothetical protein